MVSAVMCMILYAISSLDLIAVKLNFWQEFNSAPILELANAKTCYDIVNLRMTHGGCPHILSQHLDKREECVCSR